MKTMKKRSGTSAMLAVFAALLCTTIGLAITALPALRRRLDLDGATATSDAPGCRAALSESSLPTVLAGLHR